MSSTRSANNRKRKPEEVISTDDPRNRNARRVSTDAPALAVASYQTIEEAPTANDTSASDAERSDAERSDAERSESMESIGALIQDLFHFDNAKVNDALGAFDLGENKKRRESIAMAGSCLALVQVVKECLKKATEKIPACDQVTELDELAELKTPDNSLDVITNLTCGHDESKAGISSVGGVEVIVKAMKTFPKCHALQWSGCLALGILASCNLGRKKNVASGGIQALVAAVNNHLHSPRVCECACWALANAVEESKEDTEMLISLGGGAAVVRVKNKWPENRMVQTEVQCLAKLLAMEMYSWVDEE
jgi:hypothetical protein